MRVIPSICTFCGVGCGLGLRVEDGQVIGVEPQPGHPVSQGQLCAKGWATSYAIAPAERITQPLIKEHGRFRPASWDEALARVAEAFQTALDEGGPSAVGVISCARATNEDNYAAQKFARAVLGSNNIDHCARICHSPSVAGLSRTLGSGAMTNSIADIDQADLILVIGADVTENHAMIGARMLRAQARGATLVVIDPRKTRLARLADIHLQLRLGMAEVGRAAHEADTLGVAGLDQREGLVVQGLSLSLGLGGRDGRRVLLLVGEIHADGDGDEHEQAGDGGPADETALGQAAALGGEEAH